MLIGAFVLGLEYVGMIIVIGLGVKNICLGD